MQFGTQQPNLVPDRLLAVLHPVRLELDEATHPLFPGRRPAGWRSPAAPRPATRRDANATTAPTATRAGPWTRRVATSTATMSANTDTEAQVSRRQPSRARLMRRHHGFVASLPGRFAADSAACQASRPRCWVGQSSKGTPACSTGRLRGVVRDSKGTDMVRLVSAVSPRQTLARLPTLTISSGRGYRVFVFDF
jgi:hypothetical protein